MSTTVSTIFTSPNQFDPKFKNIGNFGNERNACSIFSLFTAYNFMNNGNIGKLQHENNIDAAVANFITHDNLPQYLSFDELLQFIIGNYKESDIQGITPALINEFGYEYIFKPEYDNDYCVIFLKNGNFISVLVKHNQINQYNQQTIQFCIRDCHENEQYNFNTLEDLSIHLSTKYQFQELTVVDGVLIEEFANIEYLIVNNPFTIIDLDPTLHDSNEDNIQLIDDELLAIQLAVELQDELF